MFELMINEIEMTSSFFRFLFLVVTFDYFSRALFKKSISEIIKNMNDFFLKKRIPKK